VNKNKINVIRGELLLSSSAATTNDDQGRTTTKDGDGFRDGEGRERGKQ
jgi:hypothetical protein